MNEIRDGRYKTERALFASENLHIEDTVFEEGESPLKESRSVSLKHCLFKWKYPLWYCDDIKVERCTLFETARAGIWYSNNIEFTDTIIEAPKAFRRCDGLTLLNVVFHNAQETLWNCSNVKLNSVTATNAPYFAMNCTGIGVEELSLDGNYSFDGVKNVLMKNSRLITKDAFWNSENVTVYDSFISGEYLGWNSKNLTFVNCTIESLQGMCFIDSLKMINCRLINTTLAFEHSDVEAELVGCVDSIFNPKKCTIKAEHINELIIEKDKTDKDKIHIICDAIDKVSDKPEWLL